MADVWSPETASKAYLDTIKTCGISRKSSVAEFLSAMAGGNNAKLIVEAWKNDKNGDISIATSVGLTIAAEHTGGRHVCMVPDEASRLEYVSAMQEYSGVSLPEIVVGEVEEEMRRLNGVDFVVVDGRRNDVTRVFNCVKLSNRGSILVCKSGSKGNMNNITTTSFSWNRVLDTKICVVRSVTLPFGNGLEIAYTSSNDGNRTRTAKRWIRHVDQVTGEEHVLRR